MNTRQWLSRYQMLMEEVEREARQAGYWRDKAEGLSANRLSHAPVHGHGANMADYVAEFLDLAKHCSGLGRQAEEAKDEILEVINSIEVKDEEKRDNYQRVLLFRYIDGLTYLDIAERMKYSIGHIRNLEYKAIRVVTQNDIYLSYNGSR